MAANRINNQQTMLSGGAGGLWGDDTTRDEDMHTTIKQIHHNFRMPQSKV
jgi:hypothetical protein